jgi:hypothetical protein
VSVSILIHTMWRSVVVLAKLAELHACENSTETVAHFVNIGTTMHIAWQEEYIVHIYWSTQLVETQFVVFENRMMGGGFRVNIGEVIGRCIELHNGEHHLWYPLPCIIMVNRSNIMKWAGHVALIPQILSRSICVIGKLGRKNIIRESCV